MKTTNVFAGSVLIGSVVLLTAVFAEVSDRPGVVMKKALQLSVEVPLEKFSGFYQFPNKVAFVRIELKGDALVATQLWDKKMYPLVQVDDTHFESKEEGHKVEFLKDSSGEFTQAKIMGRIITMKVDFDPNVSRQLSAAQLKRLEGTYTMKDDNSLKINLRSSADGLILKQLWDNKEVAFTPRSETFFLNEDCMFPLTFVLNGDEVKQLTCLESDVWLKAK